MTIYRILSLDGGGLRGLITGRLLQRLNEQPAIAGWLSDADLFTGTSTGGILALGLAAGKTPAEICQLYKEKADKTFSDTAWDDLRDMGKTIGADYSNKNLRRELKKIFGAMTLDDIPKKVAITTFNLDNGAADPKARSWKPKIFHNYAGADSDGDVSAVNAALYTSAAPTYFPSVDGYIDGGVFANNPSIIALAQAISSSNLAHERAALEDIVMLSVGTGVSLKYIKGKRHDWGYAQWIRPLIDILMDGVSGISDYQARQLLAERYQRLQVVFDPDDAIAMDDIDQVDHMDEIASAVDLSEAEAWIRQYWL